MLKILHMADLHLDSPFSLQNADTAQAMRQMMRGTFTSAMLYARSEKIDLVLIPGDVFDTGYAARDTLALLRSEFEKSPEIRFIIDVFLLRDRLPDIALHVREADQIAALRQLFIQMFFSSHSHGRVTSKEAKNRSISSLVA